jgi:hypothetical protein
MPSPLKSAAFLILQFGSPKSVALLDALVPFMSQTTVCPVAGLYHSKSDLPSPFKSEVDVTPFWALAESGNARKIRTAIETDRYHKDLVTKLIWNTPQPDGSNPPTFGLLRIGYDEFFVGTPTK